MPLLTRLLTGTTTGLKVLRTRREMPAMVVALALGVGLTVTVYSLIHAVLFTPLPYSRPDRLVQIWNVSREQASARLLSESDRETLAESPSPFQGMSNYRTTRQFLQRGPATTPVELGGAFVSTNVFDVLGVRAAIGRTFEPDDSRVTDIPAIVVSERLIRSGIVSGKVGELLRMEGATYRLVGVMNDAFWFPDRQTTYWVPLPVITPEMRGNANTAVSLSFPTVARLADGVAPAAAESQANARLSKPGGLTVITGIKVDSHAAMLSAPRRPSLFVIQAASGLVLVLVCLNVGWLFAARGRRLSPAFATMRALGATPGKILTTHLVSAVCVAAVAAPCAVLTAWLLLRFGLTLESGVFSRTAEPAITWHVTTFASIVTVLASLGSCLPSAVAVARGDRSRNDGSRTATRGRRVERSAMAAQVGLVFAASAQGVLMALVLLSLNRTNVGLAKSDFLVVSLVSRAGAIVEPSVQLARYKLLLEHLERRGIRAAASSIFPLTQSDSTSTFEPRRSREHQRAMVRLRIVTPSYFRLTGLAATTGRLLTEADVGSHRIVVTEAFAASVLQGRSVVGERAGGRGEWTIVGVAPAVRQFAVNEEAKPEAYVLYDDYVATQPDAVTNMRRAFILAETAPGAPATLRIIARKSLTSCRTSRCSPRHTRET